MKKEIIKKGDKFGRLTAVRFDHVGRNYQQCWLFECSCGNEKIIKVNGVKTGNTKSCGCLGVEKRLKANTKHGMAGTAIYSCWDSMIQRCLNQNHKSYKNYGGRGIKVCNKWLKFENFYKDMGKIPKGLSLDRIENNKGYYKSNCKFSTRKEQQNNTRQNHYLTHNSKTQTLAQWAEELNLNYNTIAKRLRLGWSVEKTLSLIK